MPETQAVAQEEKKIFVERKFASITRRYDLLNSLLSLNIDRYWRRLAARELDGFNGAPVLDLCAGTLPSSRAVAGRKPGEYILSLDICREMLFYGKNMPDSQDFHPYILPACADGEEIPCKDNIFSGIIVAFGVRNLSNIDRGLREMYRVLRSGGKLVILEFSRPENPFIRPLYFFYLMRLLPVIGGWISGDQEAYRYLASSIRLFCSPGELVHKMEDAGYTKTKHRPITAGIVTIYTGEKA
ncbi:MAG: ubiquinone/menaquinone biosynthesis methyltransferase [Pseudomonadota bacterium]